MKLVYVAGPYRGDVENNVKKAEEVAGQLAKAGVFFICPHSNGFPHEHLKLPDDYWCDATMEILKRCDAILVQGNFKTSRQTWEEIKESFQMRKEIFYDVQMCIDWALS
jgi:hypothetical protein